MSNNFDDLLDKVSKEVGKGKLRLLSKGFERQECNSFGLPNLDNVMAGGIVFGTIVELAGVEGSGKSSLALTLMGNSLLQGRKVIVLDAEHKLDPTLAQNLGVDLSTVPFAQPESAEECFKIIDSSLDCLGRGDVILIDSVAALTPESHFEGGFDKEQYCGNSKEISKGINLLRPKLGRVGANLILINQYREKVGVFYGSNLTTVGGRNLKYSAECRMEISRGSLIKEGDKSIGQLVTVKVIKSAHSMPFVTAGLTLYFGKGFDKTKSLLDLAISQGIIERTGAWYVYSGNKYHGEVQLIEFLTNGGYKEILEKVKI